MARIWVGRSRSMKVVVDSPSEGDRAIGRGCALHEGFARVPRTRTGVSREGGCDR